VQGQPQIEGDAQVCSGSRRGRRGWSSRRLAGALEALLQPGARQIAAQIGQQIQSEGDGAENAAGLLFSRLLGHQGN
jgi:hypothetical protein